MVDSLPESSYAVTVADLNGDELHDIIFGNARRPNVTLVNFGHGRWQKQILSDEEYVTYDIIVAELNNDHLLDIIEANSDKINRYYLNRTN